MQRVLSFLKDTSKASLASGVAVTTFMQSIDLYRAVGYWWSVVIVALVAWVGVYLTPRK